MKLILNMIVAILLLIPQIAVALCVQGDCTNGQGTVVLPDGRRYVGEFKEGIRAGRGLMTFPDGTKYLGDWQKDKPHGQGTLSSVGKFEYAGEFANGVRHGQGTLETVDGKRYVGQWQNDVPHGQGRITYPDKGEFIGEFENGRRNGQGEATYPDGTKYKGQWLDDLPNGQGTRIFPDGMHYSGEFKNGLMHGKGTVVMPDGSKFNGLWQGDVLVQKEEIMPEATFSTAEETEGHVLAVVDKKPVAEKMIAAESAAPPEPVPADTPLNIINAEADYASVNNNGVLVRSGPSTEYRIIRSVNTGFPVQKIGSQDNWTQIKDFVGQEGWIYTPLLGINNSAIVTATKANLRSGPGISYTVVNQIDFGTVLQVDNMQGDWYMITTPGGIQGWLNQELIWPAGLTVASSQELSVTEPAPQHVGVQSLETVLQIPQESTEEIKAVIETEVQTEDAAKEVQAGAAQEVMPEAVKPVETETVARALDVRVQSAEVIKESSAYASVAQNGKGANIRSEASLSSEVLRSVAPGYPLVVAERQGDWALVEDFRERKGWVHVSLLTELGTTVIKVGKGNLRNGPSLIDEIAAKLDYGTVMIVEETRGDWLKVSNPDGLTGWLHREVLWP